MGEKQKMSAYAMAWQVFEESESFTKLLNLASKVEPETGAVYLANRIKEAFDAGWNARGVRVKKAAEAMVNLFARDESEF